MSKKREGRQNCLKRLSMCYKLVETKALFRFLFYKESVVQKIYNKLVRDRIPEIIQQDGSSYRIEIFNEQEFQQALREKIREEAQEVALASGDELINELADLYEVLDTLMQQQNISLEEVHTRQAKRLQTRGGFTQRIRLLEISR